MYPSVSLAVERTEVVGSDHALAELLHSGALHDPPQLGLPDQKALQQRLLANLEVGEHAQLFHRTWREILRFVHEQQHALAVRGDAGQKPFQIRSSEALSVPLVDRPKAAHTARSRSSASSCVLTR